MSEFGHKKRNLWVEISLRGTLSSLEPVCIRFTDCFVPQNGIKQPRMALKVPCSCARRPKAGARSEFRTRDALWTLPDMLGGLGTMSKNTPRGWCATAGTPPIATGTNGSSFISSLCAKSEEASRISIPRAIPPLLLSKCKQSLRQV